MRILYILHADFERPGFIEKWAEEHRFKQSFCRPFAGEVLPQETLFDILIVMGGPQSPLSIDQAPYLKEEISLIKKALHAKKPILGFCLGAQLIGEALGARTEKSPHKEVGFYPIEKTVEGDKDPLLAGISHQFTVAHWHNDMPGLTKEATILAKSQGCPRQIVRYLPSVYGFQCHPEPMLENIQAMIAHCPEDLAPGRFVQTPAELLAHDFEEMHRIMRQILENFLELKK